MRNIETFPSKQMYPYLSLVERKVAEFYLNIDRRRWLVWLKWLIFITFSGQLMVSLKKTEKVVSKWSAGFHHRLVHTVVTRGHQWVPRWSPSDHQLVTKYYLASSNNSSHHHRPTALFQITINERPQHRKYFPVSLLKVGWRSWHIAVALFLMLFPSCRTLGGGDKGWRRESDSLGNTPNVQ